MGKIKPYQNLSIVISFSILLICITLSWFNGEILKNISLGLLFFWILSLKSTKNNINTAMSELEYLRDRSLLIIDFILNKNVGNPMMQQFKSVIQETYVKSNLKGLKILSLDMNAWAKGLPQKDIKELELLLTDKFGENLSGDKITHTVIKQVLKKGKIENEEKYRVVYEHLEDICATDPFYENILELETLLKAYQNR